MSDSNAPIIKPIKHKEYHVEQSTYAACGKLPMRAESHDLWA